MDESKYQKIADTTFRNVDDLFKDVDTNDVDCERTGDVVTLVFRDGSKCVMNTQRPTRQIWLAASSRAWHFSWDEAKEKWLDDKGEGKELFAELRAIVKQKAGLEI